MQNNLLNFIREQGMMQPGDRIVCALSGGADSVALLFALYLLREKLGITLEAAHFNHHLRGEESDRDEAFVQSLCRRYDIPLHLGGGTVTPGKKGLEAAARDARYAFLESLPGKIATAHTADDNAETLLMHLVRGTGLKGLGGIAPVRGRVIRPMLLITRQEVEDFLAEWSLPHVEDGSNQSDAFLRNRIRHQVMPLLRQENPQLGRKLSQTALRLRQDEAFLAEQADFADSPTVTQLRQMHPALRSRVLARLLKAGGVREPEDVHIASAEALVFSPNPSAWAAFPGGVIVERQYDRLAVRENRTGLEQTSLPCPGVVEFPGLRVTCKAAQALQNSPDTFTVVPRGQIFLRSRQPGDEIRLAGGTRSLKKLFIDRKIPADQRCRIPVVCDDGGILGVYSIGVNRDRAAQTLPAVTIHFEITEKGEQEHGTGN